MEQIVGTLRKDANGRFEVGSHEFTSGSSIQIFHKKSGYWLVGTVRHSVESGGEYFESDYPGIPSFPLKTGMRARVSTQIDHVATWMLDYITNDVRWKLRDALEEKNIYPRRYKKKVKEVYESLGGFLNGIEKLPYFNGIGEK